MSIKIKAKEVVEYHINCTKCGKDFWSLFPVGLCNKCADKKLKLQEKIDKLLTELEQYNTVTNYSKY